MKYYEVLGVAKTASDDEIKSAYRKLAKQYHPDRCPGDDEAAKKFREIQDAYDVLSDKSKKKNYDTYGTATGRQQHGFDDVFSNFFHFHTHQTQAQQQQQFRHVQLELELNFMEAVLGCKKEVAFDRNDLCDTCKGTGAKNGTSFEACKPCNGQGKVFVTHSFIKLGQACGACRGSGKSITEKCDICSGNGSVPSKARLEVTIPAGSFHGMRMCIKGEGEAGNGVRGDLYVFLRVQPHSYFGRDEDNLLLAVPISYSQAALGCTIEVPGLNGKMSVIVPAGTQSGALLRLKGQGINDPYYSSARGDYIIRIDVDVPSVIDEEYLTILKQLGELELKHKSKRLSEFEEKIKG